MKVVESIALNNDTPLDARFCGSLDALDSMLGFRRSALVYQVWGTAPILIGHAMGSSDEATFRKDCQNVQALLSVNGDKGVIRSALNLRSRIVLNDVTQDSRYMSGDEYTLAEACVVQTLSDTASLALNVESSTSGVFSTAEIDFLTSVADCFAMVLFRNASRLFDFQTFEGRRQMALH